MVYPNINILEVTMNEIIDSNGLSEKLTDEDIKLWKAGFVVGCLVAVDTAVYGIGFMKCSKQGQKWAHRLEDLQKDARDLQFKECMKPKEKGGE